MSAAIEARRDGMPTERARGSIRAEVLACLSTPRTAEEVADLVGIAVYVVRPRITELVKAGLVAETGERRMDSTGRRNAVWRVVGALKQRELW